MRRSFSHSWRPRAVGAIADNLLEVKWLSAGGVVPVPFRFNASQDLPSVRDAQDLGQRPLRLTSKRIMLGLLLDERKLAKTNAF